MAIFIPVLGTFLPVVSLPNIERGYPGAASMQPFGRRTKTFRQSLRQDLPVPAMPFSQQIHGLLGSSHQSIILRRSMTRVFHKQWSSCSQRRWLYAAPSARGSFERFVLSVPLSVISTSCLCEIYIYAD